MDLLRNAYSTTKDEDEENKKYAPPPLKRAKPEFSHTSSKNFPTDWLKHTSTEAPIAGRYISKRERALMATVPQTPNADPPTSSGCFHVQGSISDSYIRKDILSSLRNRTEGYANSGHKSEGISTNLIGHSKAKKARVFNIHTAAVKDVKWSDQGLYLLSCGYDCSSRLIDVEKGVETREFKEDQVVGVVKFHPNNSNLFLSGGSKGIIRLWDIRTGNTVNQYLRGLGPVLDVEFTNDTRQFVSSSDESKSNISENSIIIYVEAYTCPCIRHHPSEPYFVAQSNGNYIAIFSSKPPFRLDKYKRYESHGVSGFPVKCNFSMDGKKLASGSSDGCIYVYNAKTCELIKKIKAYEQTCIDVAFHTVMSNVIASCSWNGEISVFE
ncbi:WD40 repeat-containing protein [Cynara cardunculus var. scolymus]|uniref:WD40 repeat-containing protein n=1 Tax=Cynara cardunculus var. scolymus TaxID=59895 RepID=A0A118JZB2_CYNCS|nr:WD40 repeat-containing protein [Cynara cardunculus var. scolymus]